jgi:hypothetical protein
MSKVRAEWVVLMMTGPDFRLGDQHPAIALLRACPGKDEELHGRPFCGEAGSFLQVMMAEISKLCPQHFPSGERDDYTLLNAHHEARHAETSHKCQSRTEMGPLPGVRLGHGRWFDGCVPGDGVEAPVLGEAQG